MILAISNKIAVILGSPHWFDWQLSPGRCRMIIGSNQLGGYHRLS